MSKQGISQVLFILIILFALYFFSIRPQRKKYKDQKIFLDNLKQGMDIVTIGGIHGKILEITNDNVTIEVDANGTCITIEKNAISINSKIDKK